jgi:Domain of unknown function (DUF6316)
MSVTLKQGGFEYLHSEEFIMATANRFGEQGKAPDRNSRFIKKGSYWYYTTREGVDIGPFDSQKDAELGVTEFIEFLCESEPKITDLLRLYRAA